MVQGLSCTQDCAVVYRPIDWLSWGLRGPQAAALLASLDTHVSEHAQCINVALVLRFNTCS